jgi:hypothetical protein
MMTSAGRRPSFHVVTMSATFVAAAMLDGALPQGPSTHGTQ